MRIRVLIDDEVLDVTLDDSAAARVFEQLRIFDLRDTMEKLFTPVTVGCNTLPNRAVMAPMTRSRAEPDGTPGQHAAEYYAQRAGLGLIVTEGIQPSPSVPP